MKGKVCQPALEQNAPVRAKAKCLGLGLGFSRSPVVFGVTKHQNIDFGLRNGLTATEPQPQTGTKTLGNFVKATFDCLLKTYGFLTPDFWKETHFARSPYQEFTDLLGKKPGKPVIVDEADRVDA